MVDSALPFVILSLPKNLSFIEAFKPLNRFS